MSMIERFNEQRRQDLMRIEAMAVQPTFLNGVVKVQGSGEVTSDLTFPIRFVEKPTFTFGGELVSGHSPGEGIYPVVSGVIVGWDLDQPAEHVTHYLGTSIAIVTIGKEDQELWFHFSFFGRAMVNPVQPDQLLDDPL